MDLKSNLEGADRDPDLMKIEKIGKVGAVEALGDKIKDIDLDEVEDPEAAMTQNQAEQDFGKLLPKEFLKRIPGVNSNNMAVIIKNCKNMVELVKMPRE